MATAVVSRCFTREGLLRGLHRAAPGRCWKAASERGRWACVMEMDRGKCAGPPGAGLERRQAVQEAARPRIRREGPPAGLRH